jgi:membrane protein
MSDIGGRVSKVKGAATDRVGRLRDRHRLVDDAIRTQAHYSSAGAGQQAGAVTYYGFLSIFPIMALAFFVVGVIAKVYPNAQSNLLSAIDAVLPGLVGNGSSQVSIDTFQNAANTVGIIGLLGVLYAGLGWLASLQTALQLVFGVAPSQRTNFIVSKARDLLTLVTLGVVLGVAVVATGLVSGFSSHVLDFLGLAHGLAWLLDVITAVVGIGANMVLFYALFTLLVPTSLPRRALWSGALFGGVAFEALKQFANFLLGRTEGQPAFQIFGISLILLVWINYFTRVVLYAACLAVVLSPTPEDAPAPAVQGPQSSPAPAEGDAGSAERRTIRTFAGGMLTGAAGIVAVLLRRRNRR